MLVSDALRFDFSFAPQRNGRLHSDLDYGRIRGFQSSCNAFPKPRCSFGVSALYWTGTHPRVSAIKGAVWKTFALRVLAMALMSAPKTESPGTLNRSTIQTSHVPQHVVFLFSNVLSVLGAMLCWPSRKGSCTLDSVMGLSDMERRSWTVDGVKRRSLLAHL